MAVAHTFGDFTYCDPTKVYAYPIACRYETHNGILKICSNIRYDEYNVRMWRGIIIFLNSKVAEAPTGPYNPIRNIPMLIPAGVHDMLRERMDIPSKTRVEVIQILKDTLRDQRQHVERMNMDRYAMRRSQREQLLLDQIDHHIEHMLDQLLEAEANDRYMHHMRVKCARIIQKEYLRMYYDPSSSFCKRRLLRQMQELNDL